MYRADIFEYFYSQISMDDIDSESAKVFDWLEEHKCEHTIIKYMSIYNIIKYIDFEKEEDLLAFKLRFIYAFE